MGHKIKKTSRTFLTYKRFHCVHLRRFSYFVIINTTLEALTSYVNLPITVDLCIASYLYITSRLWNNLLDCVRRASPLNLFETKLSNLNMTTGVKCYCNFCTQFGCLLCSSFFSNEDMILALAGQFKQLSHKPEKFG